MNYPIEPVSGATYNGRGQAFENIEEVFRFTGTANDVTITDFTFDSCQYGIRGVTGNSRGLTLKNCVINNPVWEGEGKNPVLIDGGSAIHEVNMINCRAYGVAKLVDTGASWGWVIDNCKSNGSALTPVTLVGMDHIIKDSRITNCGGAAIEVFNPYDVPGGYPTGSPNDYSGAHLIENCHIENTGSLNTAVKWAIDLDCDTATVRDCTINQLEDTLAGVGHLIRANGFRIGIFRNTMTLPPGLYVNSSTPGYNYITNVEPTIISYYGNEYIRLDEPIIREPTSCGVNGDC